MDKKRDDGTLEKEKKIAALKTVTVDKGLDKHINISPVKGNVPQALWARPGVTIKPLDRPTMTEGVLTGICLTPKTTQGESHPLEFEQVISGEERVNMVKKTTHWEKECGKVALNHAPSEEQMQSHLKTFQKMGVFSGFSDA